MQKISDKVFEVKKEMALLAKDLHRLLPKALNDNEQIRAAVLPCYIDVTLGDGTTSLITLRLDPQPDRILSPLWSMPVAFLTIRFENTPQNYAKDFVDRFDLSFRRGGG